jgi:hypothetical protein
MPAISIALGAGKSDILIIWIGHFSNSLLTKVFTMFLQEEMLSVLAGDLAQLGKL